MKKFLTRNRKQSGFTIIEIMIVLAVAATIMLIVFLAVPAAQRNSRNTGIKSDVGSLLAGITEFQSNNNGALPTAATVAGDGTATISGAAGSVSATARLRGGTAVAVSATFPAAGVANTLNIAFNNKCNGNSALTSTNRSVAVAFNIETASSTANQCVDA